jgi:hypothetical protein
MIHRASWKQVFTERLIKPRVNVGEGRRFGLPFVVRRLPHVARRISSSESSVQRSATDSLQGEKRASPPRKCLLRSRPRFTSKLQFDRTE